MGNKDPKGGYAILELDGQCTLHVPRIGNQDDE